MSDDADFYLSQISTQLAEIENLLRRILSELQDVSRNTR